MELDGSSYGYLLAGALASLMAWVVLARTGLPGLARLALALMPILSSAVWLRLMVLGKPPAYQEDVLQGWVEGAHLWTQRAHASVGGESTLRGAARTREAIG
jgi:hypothetical protein